MTGARITFRLLTALVVHLAAGPLLAQDPAEAAEEDPSRHRVDFAYVAVNSRTYDSAVWALGYAYNLTAKTNLAVTVPLIDPAFEVDHNSGIGDTTIAFSWTPLHTMSVRPWVPKQMGTGLQVTLPTGTPGKGRGLDTILLSPYLGLAIPVNDRLTLLPSLLYSHSTGETVFGTDLRFLTADLGINYLHTSYWWVTLSGAFVYDLEISKRYWNYALTVGSLFTEQWGGSIELESTQYFEPGIVPGPSVDIDGRLSFYLHYNF